MPFKDGCRHTAVRPRHGRRPIRQMVGGTGTATACRRFRSGPGPGKLDRTGAAGSRHTAATVYGYENVYAKPSSAEPGGPRHSEQENPLARPQVPHGQIRMIASGKLGEAHTRRPLIVPGYSANREASPELPPCPDPISAGPTAQFG